MRVPKRIVLAALVGFGLFSALPGRRTEIRAQGQRETLVWAPVPSQPAAWVAPNKPIWKVSELLAQHKGQQSWKQTVVSDELLHADYVSMAPGEKTPRRFHPDNRAWWIVQDGQARFNIEGQEPILASKGFLVQVPYRNIYNIETVGDKPALYLEVMVANAQTMYPIDETPTPVDGFNFVKVRISGKGSYDQRNKPFLDFAQVVAGKERAGAFVNDVRAFANIIRGMPQRDNPLDKGHFHEVSAEFWFFLEGQIEYKIGNLPIFLADQGDIVYVPKQTWHRAHHAGTGYSTRVAMNGYPDLLHNYQPSEELSVQR